MRILLKLAGRVPTAPLTLVAYWNRVQNVEETELTGNDVFCGPNVAAQLWLCSVVVSAFIFVSDL